MRHKQNCTCGRQRKLAKPDRQKIYEMLVLIAETKADVIEIMNKAGVSSVSYGRQLSSIREEFGGGV